MPASVPRRAVPCFETAALVASLALLPAHLSAAAVPLDDAFLVNQTTDGSQSSPSIAANDDDDVIVVWSGPDGSDLGVFARYFPGGSTLEDEFPVNTFTAGSQAQPNVDLDAAGDFTIVWSSHNQASGTSNYDAISRYSKFGGTVLSSETALETTTTGGSLPVEVASFDEGRFVAAWERGVTSSFARVIDTDGTDSDELAVGASATEPAVDADADGNFVVAVQVGDGDASGIAVRLYEAGGLNPSALIPVNQAAAGNQHFPHVAMAANGEFFVVWNDCTASFDCNTEGRRFRSDGTPVGDEFTISTVDIDDDLSVEVDAHPDGSFVVVWMKQPPPLDLPDGASPEGDPSGPNRVISREFQRTGRPVDSPSEESAQPGQMQSAPSVAVAERFWIAAWSAPDADNSGIYARVYLRRAVFADDFEGDGFHDVWSDVVD